MSGTFPDIDSLRLELPLFRTCESASTARAFHERIEAQVDVLARLRGGAAIDKRSYETGVKNGSRLAPVIEQLRNGHGFVISGRGTASDPYRMDDVTQKPSLAFVTPEMKDAYYGLPHWQKVKHERESRDHFQCVLCGFDDELRCHHVSYANLFCEPLADLLTLCDACHSRVHESCRLAFPKGMSVNYAHWVGWKGFDTWLLP